MALFFQRQGTYQLSQTDMTRLLERTEGWVAGLQLASLILNAQGTGEGISSALRGSHRYIADYLVQEVLNALPENVQLFLQQTSLLERLQGRLCEAVTGQPEGQAMLIQLEQANLFLVPLDETRQWYRYHHLFREVLLQLLTQRAPATLAELHRHACRWFLCEQMPAEAVAHAYAASDFALLADVIEQSQPIMLQQGENATLVSWIKLLPRAVLLERPSIFFLACVEYLATQRVELAAELLNTYAGQHHLPPVGTRDVDELECAICEHVRQIVPPQQDGQRQRGAIYGFLGFYATLPLILKHDVALYRQIRQCSERYAPPIRLRRQESWLASLLEGDIEEAIADLMQNLNASTARQGNAVLFAYLYPTLTFLLMTTGQLQRVESLARRMLQREDTLDARLNHGPALIDLGSVAYERDQLERAEAFIQDGLPLCRYPGFEAIVYRGLLLLAKICHAQGDRDAAWSRLRELEVELSKSSLGASTLKGWRGLMAWEALNLGDPGYAQLWLCDNPPVQNPANGITLYSTSIILTQAFFLLRFERSAEAETLLSALTAWAKQLKLHGLLIQLLALQSLLAQTKGERVQAEAPLKEALALAGASGYARTLLDLGEEMQALLLQLWRRQHAGGRDASATYLDWLLTSARAKAPGSPIREPVPSQPLIEPLSRREREVLREISEGYSNQEIASRLVISSSTVKSHINSIYRKLQTKSRAQTIARARTLQLLPH